MNKTIQEQILAIRDSGETNMLDVTAVMHIAAREDYFELLNLLIDDKSQYVQFIFKGEASPENNE